MQSRTTVLERSRAFINVTGTYKGHHLCPYGSKKKIRKCHGAKLLALGSQEYDDKLYEFVFACTAYNKRTGQDRPALSETEDT